ncbi:MAG: hypothetical protein PVG22_08780 [Chromatiales bacterium]|jgi:hypothetical protein
MDTDLEIMKSAASAATEIDVKYRVATFADKIKLKPERDKAFNAYAQARLKLLEDGMISTEADLQTMQEIKTEVQQARDTQTLILGIGKLVGFLTKFV